ncbi:DUF397 domain-containing protein [Nocardiopsis sp. CNS-639]|uniref:DUF397 domain-containing protein n=1 Tax=Nocardiopsis sp. CNS-639 TaxID=1169153 RepID=UPI0009DBF532|nr:DUF397 domain-containing protein [Nocardiopsis sp. CNS-639]
MPTSFRESSYSGGNGNCVKATDTPAFSAVRDTWDRGPGTPTFGPGEWRVFLSTTARGTR